MIHCEFNQISEHFDKHLEVHLEPNKVYSEESYQKRIKAFELLRNDTNKILNIVSLKTVRIRTSCFNLILK